MYGDKKNILYWVDHSNQGRIKVSYTGRAVLMYLCGRTPFIYTRRVPIHLCCNSEQGPPLSGLSAVHYSISIPLSPSLSKLAGQPCWVACLLVCVSSERFTFIRTAVYCTANDSPQSPHNLDFSLIYESPFGQPK